jgi:hypothetical protein
LYGQRLPKAREETAYGLVVTKIATEVAAISLTHCQ